MKNITLFLLFLVSFPSFSQRVKEEIESKKLNAFREIIVETPPSYQTDKNRKYPLLLLLDGQYLFDPFSGILSYTSYWNDLPEVIIVGVNQSDAEKRKLETQVSEGSGLPFEESDRFFQFITSELMPYLEKNYRISPFRIVAGHDATAGFTNFFLYKEAPAFNAYISFSPELPDGVESMLTEKIKTSKKPLYYYMATADGDVQRLQKKIKPLNDSLQAIKIPNFRYYYNEFKGASHYSLVALGIPEALYQIFAVYQPITSKEYQEKIVTLPSGYVQYLEDKYNMIDKDLGIKIEIRLNDFKAIEAAILKNAKYEELKDLASLAKKNYPKTIIGEYYEGLFYEMTGNLKKAKKIYLNSYAFNEIGEYTKDFMINRADHINVD
jgi:predicted alpha/beta superfamily hydrolase